MSQSRLGPPKRLEPRRPGPGTTGTTGTARTADASRIDEAAIERALQYAFAPLHRWAFGLAIGTAIAAVVAFITIVAMLRDPSHGLGLGLLAQFFPGYRVAPSGVVIGAFWGGVAGFVAGWFVAFCRNVVLATWLLYIRVRHSLAETRDFLDHI